MPPVAINLPLINIEGTDFLFNANAVQAIDMESYSLTNPDRFITLHLLYGVAHVFAGEKADAFAKWLSQAFAAARFT